MPSSRPWRRLAVAGALTAILVGCGPGETGPVSSTRQPATSLAHPGWGDTTYRVTCDGLLPDHLRAKVVNGAARVPVDVSQSPYCTDRDVRLDAAATGDVDADGEPDTVLLLRCTP